MVSKATFRVKRYMYHMFRERLQKDHFLWKECSNLRTALQDSSRRHARSSRTFGVQSFRDWGYELVATTARRVSYEGYYNGTESSETSAHQCLLLNSTLVLFASAAEKAAGLLAPPSPNTHHVPKTSSDGSWPRVTCMPDLQTGEDARSGPRCSFAPGMAPKYPHVW